MKLSKLFERVFVFTVFLYLFFTIGSIVTSYQDSADYLNYQIAFAFVLAFIYIMIIAFKRKEFKEELKVAVTNFSKVYPEFSNNNERRYN